MKKRLPLSFLVAAMVLLLTTSCAHKYYTSSSFEQQTARHKSIAILPAEMVFTGNQPKNLSPEDIAAIEENESLAFQQSLYNGVLRNANTRKYMTTVTIQDIRSTQDLLKENNISVRESWRKDDKELARLLGVDAVVRLRIQKKRYMSDLASFGVGIGRQILSQVAINNGNIFVPWVPDKTNDIFAACSIVSNNQTLWNDNYKKETDWNTPSEQVIDRITDNFGKHFPYRKRI
ncbi:MAG TPA: hypothetical protein VHK91_05435 [Flavisolibacter sp.]|jgi:hypothetical protein|nr:hypothetical protein [Flavisolibacter sp.]